MIIHLSKLIIVQILISIHTQNIAKGGKKKSRLQWNMVSIYCNIKTFSATRLTARQQTHSIDQGQFARMNVCQKNLQ